MENIAIERLWKTGFLDTSFERGGQHLHGRPIPLLSDIDWRVWNRT